MAQKPVMPDRLPQGSPWVLQITDTHLYADPKGSLLGINTLESLKQVLACALECLPRKPDLLLATGDLVHDASSRGYQNFAEAVLPTGVPIIAIPGNHDDPQVMKNTLQPMGITCGGAVSLGIWKILALDTHVPKYEGGRISAQDLAWLERKLASDDAPTLIATHHHPQPIDSAWLDGMAIENGAALMEIAQRFAHVKGIAFGHIHQAYDHFAGNVRLMATPSTCIQFSPKHDKFRVEKAPPACRIIVLGDDGRLESCLIELKHAPQEIDFSSAGYR